MENLLELHYEKLIAEHSRPGTVITRFYGELFQRKTSRKEIIMFNRLIKIYGRFIVFFSVLDLTGVKNLKHDNLTGLLFAICKQRFEKAHPRSIAPTSKKLRTVGIENEMEKAEKRRIKLPEISELD